MKSPGEYSVHYETRDHWKVISQMHGSVWPHIWKYCVFNLAVMLLDFYVLDAQFEKYGIKVTDKGHTISIFFVAFFCVSRANMALARYNTARNNLSSMMGATRELVVAVSIHTKNDQSQAAKEWRNMMAFYSCLLLRLAMAACDYEEERITPWDVPELHGEIREKILKSTQSKGHTSKWGFAKRTEMEEVQRVPFIMSQHLRIAIYDHTKYLKTEVSAPFMLKFNGLLDGFVSAYSNQEKMFKTPMPFPMVQMARTMMFLWIYTLPFALSSDSSTIYVHCVVVFLLTYAFMGLETVSLELDDPFGHDENDFDNLGMAKTVFEDVINAIDIVDGPEWAFKVRVNMKGSYDDIPGESSSLLSV